jgi:autotransporter translocation and assembly factor TamB
VLRRLTHVLVLVLTLIIGAAAAAVLVSQTAWFKNWIRAYIVREASVFLNGTLQIERLDGNLLFGLEMENVGVSMDGRPVVTVKDVGLDYNIWDFVTKGLSIDNLRLDKPVIVLRREGDTWTLSRLLKKQEAEADRRGPMRPVSIEAIGVSDASFVVDGPVGTSGVDVPKRFDHLDAKLSFKYEPVRYSIDITHLSFRASEPAIALNALSGGVSVKDDAVYFDKLAIRTAETSLAIEGAVQQYLTHPVMNLHVSSDKLSVPELARVLPALAGLTLQPEIDVKLAGPAEALNIEMNAVAKAGRLSGKVVADLQDPDRSVRGTVSVRNLDLSEVFGDPRRKSDVTADARVDLHAGPSMDVRSLRGTVGFDAPQVRAAGYAAERLHGVAKIDGRRVALDARGAAYGAAASATGRITLPEGREPIAFDVRGRAQHVDLRRLPKQLNAPQTPTDVNAEYHAAGTVAQSGSAGPIGVDLRFAPSTIAGARVENGSTAAVSISGGRVVDYKADATVADLDLQRVGREFRIPALDTDQYKTAISGHVVANGRGTSMDALDLTASGTLSETAFAGGRVSDVTFDANVAHDTAHVKANGRFSDVDPAAISGKPALQGHVAGALDVDATIRSVSQGVTPDTVDAKGTVTLDPSTVGGVDITRASLDADYHASTADVRTVDVVGPLVSAQGKGTIALNDSGSSNFELHGQSDDLSAVGTLVDQPLSGNATVDATITGNRRELQASGHLSGYDIAYGDQHALTLSSDFTAKVPELRAADATVKADSRATFATIAGRELNELDATATYHQQQLDVDLAAKEPQRSLAAKGSLVLHPDHQEVHLERFDLQTAGMTWQLAPGSAPAVQYRPEHVEVKDLKLVSGTQTISADGAFGQPQDALKVTLSNVDVASVDALLLREPQLSGRLNASSTIHASPAAAGDDSTVAGAVKRAPEVDAEFQIAQGGFRQFRYDAFGGTVKYRGKGLTVDARLQQNPTTSVTAKGYLPAAIFGTTPAETREAAHDAPVAPEDRVDLHIESTPIDLGIVQGFTTELTNVTGTLQANIDVTGSADDPHPTGLITLQKGAFTVPSTGVSYNNFEGKVELAPDVVRVGAITVLDNHYNALNISGDLAVHERQLAGVRIYIHSDDFKVIDNKTGNIRVNTDLEIAGELRSPRIEGLLGVTTGMINLDPILATFGESYYATKQTEYSTTAPQAKAGASGKPAPFSLAQLLSGLAMNVHVTVPDDLVVKGTDLASGDSPVGLGTLTVTLGGDLRATKEAGGDVVLTGPVNTVRGSYTFQGRRFDILRDGSVRFTGNALRDLDPSLDIRTERMIQAVAARVNIRGTLKQPEIVLESTPPLEQADILSLIVFNQPANLLGENEQVQLGQRAMQIATGAVAGALARSIEQALNLNTFEISAASGTGAELTIGQQVGRNLFVRLEQGVGDQSQTNFIVEYELQKWLRMRTNVVQNQNVQQQLFQRMQGSGVDLLFFFSY